MLGTRWRLEEEAWGCNLQWIPFSQIFPRLFSLSPESLGGEKLTATELEYPLELESLMEGVTDVQWTQAYFQVSFSSPSTGGGDLLTISISPPIIGEEQQLRDY